jgi:O-antigen ligase
MAAVLILLVIPAFFVSLYWLQNTAPEKVATKQGEFTKLLELSDPGGTVGRRLELYRQAIEGFAEKPFLGWGIGSFSVYAAGSDKRLYPHNLVLLIAVEQGLLGLAAFAALLIALARALKKIIAVTEGKWVFLVWVILYCLTNAMVSGDLDDQRALLLWCGVAFASCRMLTLRLRERPPFTEGRVAVAST